MNRKSHNSLSRCRGRSGFSLQDGELGHGRDLDGNGTAESVVVEIQRVQVLQVRQFHGDASLKLVVPDLPECAKHTFSVRNHQSGKREVQEGDSKDPAEIKCGFKKSNMIPACLSK